MSTLAAVLLEHALPGDPHFDWMIEDPDRAGDPPALLCWRLPLASSDWAGAGELAARKLAAHRRDYLTYEGPVGGGRGSVRRVDSGTVRLVGRSDGRLDLDVHLERFAGRICMRQVSGPDWTLAAEAEESSGA